MKRYFYKLYKNNLSNFQTNVFRRFQEFDKRSTTKFIKALLSEVSDLFLKIGGRLSLKSDVPQIGQYPDSKKFNRLVTNVDYDLNKLYSAQKLIQDDLNNLINFNQLQREKSLTNLLDTQQSVYSVYVKSKKDIIGGYEIPGGSPFISASHLSPESDNVLIDEARSVLTLASSLDVQKPVDTQNVNIYLISDSLANKKLYPNSLVMAPGSHWKKESNDPYFRDLSNTAARKAYLGMLVDDDDSDSVGICEFESVITRTNINLYNGVNLSEERIKLELSKRYTKSPGLIYIDSKNSMQSEYSSPYLGNFLSGLKTFKLMIPFTNATVTNQLNIDFSANTYNGIYPIVDWDRSKIYSNSVAYGFSPLADTDGSGLKIGKIISSIVPTRAEIIVRYEGTPDQVWPTIKFYMSHYTYDYTYTYDLPQPGTTPLSMSVTKVYNIFVDSEPNQKNEEQRALNVLAGING